MVRLGNFEFSIIDDHDTKYLEYSDPSPNPDPTSFASCYIESPLRNASKRFRIKVQAIKPLDYNLTNGYGFSIFCDGREDLYTWVISTPKLFEIFKSVIIDAYCVKDRATGNYSGKKLQFNPLQSTDSGDDAGYVNAEMLGTIEISIGEISGIYLVDDDDIEQEGGLQLGPFSIEHHNACRGSGENGLEFLLDIMTLDYLLNGTEY
ncbi:hypothetical protein BJ508DRAFT_326733 [Ascobolus immersus RN42]|uniref:DUF7918 domain-containing protein n=1 Tax=Ascobolus immersus RN42 TaxID=1160509 RepID=A0A3N4I4V4_ASCIM|nr:hypothetical protein BJ508DRAFT_326733 [Ascobolus immersus RN42]